jgi:hypothetical protein
MTAQQSTLQGSIRRTMFWFAIVTMATTIGACSKKSDSGASGGATKAGAVAKLTDLQAAYKAELSDASKMNDPMDKKISAFLAKVGKPATDDGRKQVWFAADGDKCSKVELDMKDGSMMEETTDKGKCGM